MSSKRAYPSRNAHNVIHGRRIYDTQLLIVTTFPNSQTYIVTMKYSRSSLLSASNDLLSKIVKA